MPSPRQACLQHIALNASRMADEQADGGEGHAPAEEAELRVPGAAELEERLYELPDSEAWALARAVARLMVSDPSSASFREAGCVAVYHVVHSRHFRLHDSGRLSYEVILVEHGAEGFWAEDGLLLDLCRALLAAAREFPGCPRINSWVFMTLHRLLSANTLPPFRDVTAVGKFLISARSAAFEIIIAAVRELPDCAILQHNALEVLRVLRGCHAALWEREGAEKRLAGAGLAEALAASICKLLPARLQHHPPSQPEETEPPPAGVAVMLNGWYDTRCALLSQIDVIISAPSSTLKHHFAHAVRNQPDVVICLVWLIRREGMLYWQLPTDEVCREDEAGVDEGGGASSRLPAGASAESLLLSCCLLLKSLWQADDLLPAARAFGRAQGQTELLMLAQRLMLAASAALGEGAAAGVERPLHASAHVDRGTALYAVGHVLDLLCGTVWPAVRELRGDADVRNAVDGPGWTEWARAVVCRVACATAPTAYRDGDDDEVEFVFFSALALFVTLASLPGQEQFRKTADAREMFAAVSSAFVAARPAFFENAPAIAAGIKALTALMDITPSSERDVRRAEKALADGAVAMTCKVLFPSPPFPVPCSVIHRPTPRARTLRVLRLFKSSRCRTCPASIRRNVEPLAHITADIRIPRRRRASPCFAVPRQMLRQETKDSLAQWPSADLLMSNSCACAAPPLLRIVTMALMRREMRLSNRPQLERLAAMAMPALLHALELPPTRFPNVNGHIAYNCVDALSLLVRSCPVAGRYIRAGGVLLLRKLALVGGVQSSNAALSLIKVLECLRDQEPRAGASLLGDLLAAAGGGGAGGGRAAADARAAADFLRNFRAVGISQQQQPTGVALPTPGSGGGRGAGRGRGAAGRRGRAAAPALTEDEKREQQERADAAMAELLAAEEAARAPAAGGAEGSRRRQGGRRGGSAKPPAAGGGTSSSSSSGQPAGGEPSSVPPGTAATEGASAPSTSSITGGLAGLSLASYSAAAAPSSAQPEQAELLNRPAPGATAAAGAAAPTDAASDPSPAHFGLSWAEPTPAAPSGRPRHPGPYRPPSGAAQAPTWEGSSSSTLPLQCTATAVPQMLMPPTPQGGAALLPDENDEEVGEETCCVCIDRPPSLKLQPCGALTASEECSTCFGGRRSAHDWLYVIAALMPQFLLACGVLRLTYVSAPMFVCAEGHGCICAPCFELLTDLTSRRGQANAPEWAAKCPMCRGEFVGAVPL